MKRSLLLPVLLVLLIVPGRAHESRPAYLEFKQTETDHYDLLWKVPARGPEQRLALYVRLAEDTRVIEPARTSYVNGAFIERSAIARDGGLAGAEIYIEGLSTTLTDVLVRIQRRDGSGEVTRLTPSKPSFVVGSTPGFLDVAGTYLVLGVEHIWQGIDHLLFVACLTLIAGSKRRILVTITGFTLAHSITLALAALGLVRVPVPPIEATIALSIVFLAREIALAQRETLTWRFPIAVSALFGLLHGFGFASALSEIGLPQTEISAALLSFNIGVEIGQILFVAGILALAWATKAFLRRYWTKADDGLHLARRPFAYAVGAITMLWTAERVLVFWN